MRKQRDLATIPGSQSSTLFHLMIMVLALWFVIGLGTTVSHITHGMLTGFVWIKFAVLALTLPIIVLALFQYRRIMRERRYLQLLFQNMREGVTVCKADGSVEYANLKAKAIIKNGKTDFARLFDEWDFFNTSDGTQITEQNHPMAAALQGKAVHQLVRAVSGRGERFLIIEATPLRTTHGQIDGALAVFRDISDYKLLERRSEDRRQMYELLVDNVSDLIEIVDFDGTVLYASPSHETILGTQQQDAIGKSALLHVHPDDVSHVRDCLCRLQTERTNFQIEFRYVDPQEHSIVVDAKLKYVSSTRGERTGILIVARDITFKKRAEQILHGRNKILRQIVNGATLDAMIGEIIDQIELFQQPISCVIATRYNGRIRCFGPSTPDEVTNAVQAILGTDMFQHSAAAFNEAAAETIYLEFAKIKPLLHRHNILKQWLKPIFTPDGTCSGYFIIFYNKIIEPSRDDIAMFETYMDLTALLIHQRSAAEQLEYLAHYDALTGIANGRAIESRLQHIIALDDSEQQCAVLFIDIDRFHSINDTFGHDIGDRVIQALARRISTFIASRDLVCRVGGDKFITLLTGRHAIKHILRITDDLVRTVIEPIHVGENEFRIAVSVGIALYPDHGATSTELFKNADTAMYDAKSRGHNMKSMYAPDMNAEFFDRITLEKDILKAIENGEFSLSYQPKIEAQTHRVVGAEALIRWTHPLHGAVSPANFIPIAEEMGVITTIGRWVIDTAVRQLKAWEMAGHPMVPIAVNVSAHQLSNPSFPRIIQSILEQHNLEYRWLELEVTETAIITYEEVAARNIHELANLGIAVTLDDFGTGYSSLSYLTRFKFGTIKIDRSFVDALSLGDSTHENIAMTIISIAHHLGMKAVAEGVETQDQLEFLESHACDVIQGYLFSKPLPLPTFERFLQGELRLAENT